MLYLGFNILPRSVFWSADFNGRSDNLDVIRLPEDHCFHSDMKFQIRNLLFLTAFAALAVTALRYPNPYLAGFAAFAVFFALTIAAVIAFDRRSTPFAGFVAFGLLGASYSDFLAGYLGLPLMAAMNIPTGSVEYGHVLNVLTAYVVFLSSCVGYVIGVLISWRGELRGESTD